MQKWLLGRVIVNSGVSVESLLKVGKQPVKLGSLLVVGDLNSKLKLETLETRITVRGMTTSIHITFGGW